MKRNMGETIWVIVTKMFLFSFWLHRLYFLASLAVQCGDATTSGSWNVDESEVHTSTSEP